MRVLIFRFVLLVFALLTFGCASSRPLPKYETPVARAQFQTIRTTAYTHTESDHRPYAHATASGTSLRHGKINSAACDWSRWPLGTVFRIQETGEIFEVDDYGWALAGTNTIDLYKPSRDKMNAWGVRRVNLEILRWGDADRSLGILRDRTKYAHVRRMVDEIKERYAEISAPINYTVASVTTNVMRPAMIAPDHATVRPALTPFR